MRNVVSMNTNISIRKLNSINDIALIKKTFTKPDRIFDKYFQEFFEQKRDIFIAVDDGELIGYITLKWESDYLYFRENNIPEISDFNVLKKYRNKGVGSRLLKIAESEAAKEVKIIGIGVGLYTDQDGGYGPAQILYVKKGYIPDGRGMTSGNKHIEYGQKVTVDDDLILWFTKKLG